MVKLLDSPLTRANLTVPNLEIIFSYYERNNFYAFAVRLLNQLKLQGLDIMRRGSFPWSILGILFPLFRRRKVSNPKLFGLLRILYMSLNRSDFLSLGSEPEVLKRIDLVSDYSKYVNEWIDVSKAKQHKKYNVVRLLNLVNRDISSFEIVLDSLKKADLIQIVKSEEKSQQQLKTILPVKPRRRFFPSFPRIVALTLSSLAKPSIVNDVAAYVL
jgi:hypothetical protein